MPDPSACGYPDLESVGVDPLIPRTTVSGVVTLSTPGQVYQDRTVNGSIVVTAPNVTIRNVQLNNTNPYYAISVKNAGSWERSDANLLIDRTEINLGGGYTVKGVAFNGYTMRRSFMHNGSDCAHFSDNVVLEDNLCVSGPDTNSDGWPDGNAFCSGPDHFDGFQTDGARGVTIRHNTMRNPCGQTSNILLSSNTSHVSTVTIDDNLLAGGGYTLYCAGMNDGSTVDNIVATNNRFARTWFPRSGYWGPTAYCEFADVFTGNVWDSDGSPL
jgi:hypothetical protein